jgi:hypothetical protein
LGKKQKKPRKSNAFCIHCGRWASNECSFCRRSLCDDCFREWGDEQVGHLTTCQSNKCQSKVTSEVRQATAKNIRSAFSDVT